MPRAVKPRILLVEDDPGVSRSLAKALTTAGYEVVLAANGVEATRLWREGKGGDLVILDLFMPQKDGLECIVEFRAQSPDVPIIAMTGGGGSPGHNILWYAELLGADATLEKPFDPRLLLALVARKLGRDERKDLA